ncbi:phosphorylase kinase alpha/beta subunit [Marinagarivorans cellulosilyticus]|uniref:Phosphorylase kinase alpha/beta subunit n=2 Tax=Marinagarivorans cellulosilyticus TaxID=2721545 RepID=A0AAN1WJ72_9GAMM|nr:phosphorylase kinase alpha/beta subunit [Marinagarivorans cellulosilyticus]
MPHGLIAPREDPAATNSFTQYVPLIMNNREKLDAIFDQVETVIMCRQHPVTGLMPASTAVTTHGDYTDAWVRDNVYSIMSIWALGLAYRRQHESERADQLEQTTIKLMRGLLLSMMRQADKVEKFKHTLHPLDALHAKYDTATGLPVVADDAWGHLQIDATSIFLLMMAQMTGSGLRIIRTFGEVDFIQNLVYYISSAYRIPDFGIWERGNKINNGKPEINASSVGMAKAALQALDGFNLFGPNASKRAVIHTIPDAVSLARNTLASLLPRESLSKEVDSALLSIIGFPAFAVGNKKQIETTRNEILSKLAGEYGCKRFLWDGHQTAIEESSRIYYEHSELASFEHIESEWPLFYTYLYIQALFEDDKTQAKAYRQKLESLMVNVDGFGLLPELFYVPTDSVDAERKNPRSQKRVANENVPLVWAQSMYITGLLLDEGYVTKDDLDPLVMRRRSRRFTKSQIALVVLAENDEIKQHLAKHGVIAESLDDINPVKVISAPHLVQAYTQVGANDTMGLTGRPSRRLQSLATSQTYTINGTHCLCLSWLQSEQNGYRSFDTTLATQNIERELAHIHNHWLSQEVAVFTWMVDQRFCETPGAAEFFDALWQLQLRSQHEHVGYASANLALRAARDNQLHLPNLCLTPFKTRSRDISEYAPKLVQEHLITEAAPLFSADSDLALFDAINAFMQGRSLEDNVNDNDVNCGGHARLKDLIKHVYFNAQIKNQWLSARTCFSILGHTHIDLGDALTMLAARHLSISVGDQQKKLITLAQAKPNAEIYKDISEVTESALEHTLIQEVLATIGGLMRTRPDLFKGLGSVQLHNLLRLCCKQEEGKPLSLEELGAQAPSYILNKIETILESQRQLFSLGVTQAYNNKRASYAGIANSDAEAAHAIDTDWFEWRVERGLITNFDEDFLLEIWQSLAQARHIVFGGKDMQDFTLDCELTRSSMTPSEASFAQHIDQLTHHIHPAYFKSAVIEALYGFTHYCSKNPDVFFEQPVVIAQIVEAAAHKLIIERSIDTGETRDIDILLQESPATLQTYVEKAITDMAEAQQQ